MAALSLSAWARLRQVFFLPVKTKLVKHLSGPQSDRPLLLMEFDEKETCPSFDVTTFLAVSCREAGNAMKELVKSGGRALLAFKHTFPVSVQSW